MVTADDRNYRRFNMILTCHAAGILHHHARPFSLYPPMTYSQAYDHSVTDGVTNTMLLIGTPLVVTCWRNFIHSCGTHFSPLFSKWRSQFRKYRAGGMICAAWLIFLINDSSVSVLIFVEANAYFMSVFQAVCFSFGRNTLSKWVFMSHPRHVLCLDRGTSPTSFLKDSG